MFTYLTMTFESELTNQLNRSRDRHALTVEVPPIAIRKAENVWSSIFFQGGAGLLWRGARPLGGVQPPPRHSHSRSGPAI